MAFSTYGSNLAYDKVLRRGVAGAPAKVVNPVTGEQLVTYSMDEQPAPLITDALGYIGDFKVAGLVPAVDVTIGQRTMGMISREAILASATAIDQAADAVDVAASAAASSSVAAWEAANLVGAPADAVIKALVAAVGSLTRVQLDSLYGSLVTTVKPGLMLASDKEKLDASTPVVDSAMAPTGQVTYHWAGTPHASQSIKRIDGVEVARNLATNPSGELAGSGFFVAPGTGGAGALSLVADAPRVGASTVRQTWSVGSQAGSPGINYSVFVSGNAGDIVSARASVRSSKPKRIGIIFRFRMGSTVVGTQTTEYITAPGGQWADYEAHGIVATGAYDSIQVYALITNGIVNAPGDWIDLDAILLEPGAAGAGPYFDGDTPWETVLWLTPERKLMQWNGTAWAWMKSDPAGLATTTELTSGLAAKASTTDLTNGLAGKASTTALAGKSDTGHTHTQIQVAAGHLIRVSAGGYVDHVVDGVTVWTVTPAGVLSAGSVPFDRMKGILTGITTITPTAVDVPTAVNVTFPVGYFTAAPTVVPNAITDSPGVVVKGWSARSATKDGFVAWATRGTMTTTTIGYIAIGA